MPTDPPPRPPEDELVALLGRLELDGQPLTEDSLWEERLRAIAAQLPDGMVADIAARMRKALGADMVDFDYFAHQHGLTPAETRLVKSLARGLSVPDHASDHGISVNTARVHMQRVLDKTGARGQTDLVRRLLG